jgi:hypothetical protein
VTKIVAVPELEDEPRFDAPVLEEDMKKLLGARECAEHARSMIQMPPGAAVDDSFPEGGPTPVRKFTNQPRRSVKTPSKK